MSVTASIFVGFFGLKYAFDVNKVSSDEALSVLKSYLAEKRWHLAF
jgi:hypothetical protein